MTQLLVALVVAVAAQAAPSPSAAPRIPRVPQVPAPRVPTIPQTSKGPAPHVPEASAPRVPRVPEGIQGQSVLNGLSAPQPSGLPCPCEGKPRVDKKMPVSSAGADGDEPKPKVALPDGLPEARQTARPQPPTLPADLQGLVDRIEADPGSPEWKRTIAERIRARRIGKFAARLTVYCTDPSVDPQGGGPNAAWGGIPLRWGHAASDWGEIPKGSVLYLPPPVDTILIVVDNGPGVQGPGRIDVCTTDAGQYFDLCSMVSVNRPLPCWRLGRKTTSREAR